MSFLPSQNAGFGRKRGSSRRVQDRHLVSAGCAEIRGFQQHATSKSKCLSTPFLTGGAQFRPGREDQWRQSLPAFAHRVDMHVPSALALCCEGAQCARGGGARSGERSGGFTRRLWVLGIGERVRGGAATGRSDWVAYRAPRACAAPRSREHDPAAPNLHIRSCYIRALGESLSGVSFLNRVSTSSVSISSSRWAGGGSAASLWVRPPGGGPREDGRAAEDGAG